MKFDYYLKKQLELHPSMQMQDIIKMCYQAVFGVEHMLADAERARTYFTQEYEATNANTSLPLYEPISDEFCRVNLGAWKAKSLEPQKLFELFLASANDNHSGEVADFELCIAGAEKIIANGLLPFSIEEWTEYFDSYKKSGIHPVHHSDAYRRAEQPAYRLISLHQMLPYRDI